MYSQEIINIGTLPNDGTGDPLRTAYAKINNNFSNLFTTFVNSTVTYTTGATANQVIFQYPVSTFTGGQFTVESIEPGTVNRQNIVITAQINATADAVKFTGYGSTFFGNAVATYNMDVSSGNVRILTTPLGNINLTHSIASQITWINPDDLLPE